jgi:hypothetical protein
MMQFSDVTNCQECPFANNDNQDGYDSCRINDEIWAKVGEQLPSDKVHELCPLKKCTVVVRLTSE